MKAKYYSNRTKAIKYLGGKCVDCGSIFMLEFDHVRDKEDSVSRMLNGNWDKLLVELKKCELRCTSCHAHMTAFRKLENVNLLIIE